MFQTYFPLIELYLPLVVMFIAIYSLLSTNFTASPRLASSYAWLGLFAFMIRVPMLFITPFENEFGRILIVILGLLSGYFFYCAWRIGQAAQPAKPTARKGKTKK